MLFVTVIRAQLPISVSEDSLQFGNSIMPAISVTIPEVAFDKTLKAWINDLQSGTKSKVVSENNDLTIFGARIKKITPDPVNVYSRLTANDSVLLLVAAFEMKKDQYIGKAIAEKELSQAENYLKLFAKEQYLNLVKDQVNEEEKKLRDIEKELSSLEKDKSKDQKSISSNNNTINDQKDNLIVMNNELTTVSSALIGHNTELKQMEEGPEKEAKIAVISELEKRKKRALKSIKSSEKRIRNAESSIRKSERAIPKNEDNQELIKERLDQQDIVVQKYTDKLNNVKNY